MADEPIDNSEKDDFEKNIRVYMDTDPSHPDAYLTTAQAAATLGVTQGAIRRAVTAGRLQAIHVVGRVLITPAAIEEYRIRTQPEGVKKVGRPRKTPDPSK